MKVKELMEALKQFDPELPVGVLHDNGVMSTNEVGIYEGLYLNGDSPKMIYKREKRQFVAIGNPGNYAIPAYEDNCKDVFVLIL